MPNNYCVCVNGHLTPSTFHPPPIQIQSYGILFTTGSGSARSMAGSFSDWDVTSRHRAPYKEASCREANVSAKGTVAQGHGKLNTHVSPDPCLTSAKLYVFRVERIPGFREVLHRVVNSEPVVQPSGVFQDDIVPQAWFPK